MEYQTQPQQNIPQVPIAYTPEGLVDNIVAQIDPQQIIDNFDHALRGEYYNKERGEWTKNEGGEPLVNDACRSAVVSFLTGILNNNSTMSIIDKTQLSNLMEGVIRTVNRMFLVNLEKYGFVPPGPGFKTKEYENKGTPNTAQMTIVSEMIFAVSYLVYARSLNGMESRKVFSSLNLTDNFNYGHQPQQGGNWMGKMFG